MVVSPQYATDGVVLAWRGEQLFRSVDGGQSFEKIGFASATITNVVAGTAGDFYLAARPTANPRQDRMHPIITLGTAMLFSKR